MGRILLIEDDEIMQKVVEKILLREGFTVDVARNGKEGLQKLEENNYNYNMMITDIMMPYANGFEIISKVKTEAKGNGIPVIIISSVGNEDSVLEGFKLGADDYLKKPIMAGELILRVKRLLTRRQIN